MSSTEPINSTFEDRLIHQNTRLEKEKDQGLKNVVQQSIHEEKLANNGLLASIFMHYFIIISTLIIILFKMNLFNIYHENNPEQEIIYFNLLEFNLNKTSYSYSCFIKLNETECEIQQDCINKKLNSTLIQDLFEVECSQFLQLKILGIIVKYNITNSMLVF